MGQSVCSSGENNMFNKKSGETMKRLLLTTMIVALPVFMMAQDDDMYFVPSQKPTQTTDVRYDNSQLRTSATGISSPGVAVYNTRSRDDDEYNRRYSAYGGTFQASGQGDSLTAEVETVDDSGASYNDEDYYYSRRILRFRSPRVGIAISSPWYWDLVYSYGAYDYLYDDIYFYDPFFWNYGWSYGWSWGPWNSWYGGIWGWHRPYHWCYWGWGPGWHHPHGGWAFHRPNRYQRGVFPNHFDRGSRIRTNVLANGGNAATSRGTFGSSRLAQGTSRGTSRTTIPTGNRSIDNARVSGISNGQRGTTSGSYSNYSRSRSTSSYDRSRATNSRNSTYTRPNSSRSSNYSSGNRSTRSTYTPSQSSSTSRSSSFGSSRSSGSVGGGSRGSGGGGSRGGGGGRR